MKPKILVVEDDPDGSRSVKEAIEDNGFDVMTAATGGEGVRKFTDDPYDAVITDLVLPDISGLDVMNGIHKVDPLAPVIIMTAYGTVQSAVDAMKKGAYDYITKPLNLDDLQAKVARATETRRLRREVERLQTTAQERLGAGSIIAVSPAMKSIVDQVGMLAATTTTVLIQGESGTGKEVVARALHFEGKRKGGPFVAVNCGAFAENLLESELFGHEKGSFTGASDRRRGAFERADGGTLFLDEVGTAPMSVQVKLLRILEDREVMRVGGEKPIRVDVRLISASNQELDDMVRAGRFREDLLYRLNVFTLRIAPLRERREDIRPLIDRFVAATCDQQGRTRMVVSPEVYAVLENYDWPGNVRQLRNVIEASVVLSSGDKLDIADLKLGTAPRKSADGKFTVPENMTLADVEREVLAQMLRRCDGNRTVVADRLGLSRRTIQRKIKDYGLPY